MVGYGSGQLWVQSLPCPCLVKTLEVLDRRGIQTLDYRGYKLQGMVEVLTADYPVVAV